METINDLDIKRALILNSIEKHFHNKAILHALNEKTAEIATDYKNVVQKMELSDVLASKNNDGSKEGR